MGLSQLMMTQLLQRIEPGVKIASMGYPDIVGVHDIPEGTAYRKDSAVICKRHGIDPPRQIPDASSFFLMHGATLHVFDIVQERGEEILCDLNYPMEEDVYVGQYDFVLDVGTLEHCFQIGQAAFNMASLLKVGGVILHENPFNWGNHGFYGLNPTWYADFYLQNGFKLLDCRIVVKDESETIEYPTQRFKFLGSEANLFAVAQREEIKAFTFPTQTKYKRAINKETYGTE